LQKHKLGFTGFGIDDFIYEEARATPIFRWFKTTFRENKMVKLLEHNVDRISDIINEKYNSLRNSIQGLTVERDKVVFGSTNLRTYMITPLYQVSDKHITMPIWCDEDAWRHFLTTNSGFYGYTESTIPSPSTPLLKLCESINIICSTNQQKKT
jgi:hypothetical protein